MKENKMERIINMLIHLKLFYSSFLQRYRSIFCYYFLRYSKFSSKIVVGKHYRGKQKIKIYDLYKRGGKYEV